MKPVAKTSLHPARPELTKFETKFASTSSAQKEFYNAMQNTLLQLVKDQRENIIRTDVEFVKTILNNLNEQYFAVLLNSLTEKQDEIVDQVFSTKNISAIKSKLSGTVATTSSGEKKETISTEHVIPYLDRQIRTILDKTIVELKKRIDQTKSESTSKDVAKKEKDEQKNVVEEKEQKIDFEPQISSSIDKFSQSFAQFKEKHLSEISNLLTKHTSSLKATLSTISFEKINPSAFKPKATVAAAAFTGTAAGIFGGRKQQAASDPIAKNKTPTYNTASSLKKSINPFLNDYIKSTDKLGKKQENAIGKQVASAKQFSGGRKHNPLYHMFDLFMPIGIILGLFKGITGLVGGAFKIVTGVVKGIFGLTKFLTKTIVGGINLLIIKPLKLAKNLIGKFVNKIGLKKIILKFFGTAAGAFVLGFVVGSIVKFGLNIYHKVIDWANSITEKLKNYGRDLRERLEETSAGRWVFSVLDKEFDVFKEKGFKGIWEDFEKFFEEDLSEKIIEFLSWSGGVFQAVQQAFKEKMHDEIAKQIGGAAGGIIGSVLGSFIPIPVVGTMIGGFIGSWLGEMAGPYVAKGISWINGNYYKPKGKDFDELKQYSINTGQGVLKSAEDNNVLLENLEQGADLSRAISAGEVKEEDLTASERDALALHIVSSNMGGDEGQERADAMSSVSEMISTFESALTTDASKARKIVMKQQKETDWTEDTIHPELFTSDFTSALPWHFGEKPNQNIEIAAEIERGDYFVTGERTLNFPMFLLARSIMLRTLINDWKDGSITNPAIFIKMWNELADPRSNFYNYKWIGSGSMMSETDASFKHMFTQRAKKYGKQLAFCPNSYFQIYNDDLNFSESFFLKKDRVYYNDFDSRSNSSDYSGYDLAKQYQNLSGIKGRKIDYKTDPIYAKPGGIRARFINNIREALIKGYKVDSDAFDFTNVQFARNLNKTIDSYLGPLYERRYAHILAQGGVMDEGEQERFVNELTGTGENAGAVVRSMAARLVEDVIYPDNPEKAKEIIGRIYPDLVKKDNSETIEQLSNPNTPEMEHRSPELEETVETAIQEGSEQKRQEQIQRSEVIQESMETTADSIETVKKMKGDLDRLSHPDVIATGSSIKGPVVSNPAQADAGEYSGIQ